LNDSPVGSALIAKIIQRKPVQRRRQKRAKFPPRLVGHAQNIIFEKFGDDKRLQYILDLLLFHPPPFQQMVLQNRHVGLNQQRQRLPPLLNAAGSHTPHETPVRGRPLSGRLSRIGGIQCHGFDDQTELKNRAC
jgi:hypothetical protein